MFARVRCGPTGLLSRSGESREEPPPNAGGRSSAIMLSPFVACDFFVVVTARFRILFVFLMMEIGTRRILHCNVTGHPTAEWTLQQFREAIPCDHPYRFLIRDRDSIFSVEVDDQLKAFGLRVLRTPTRAPQANAYCERLVGTARRECLDFMIPLRNLTVDISQLTFTRSWLVRSSAGSTTNTVGKGWQRERPTAEKTACPDHLSARVTDDRGASTAPRDSRAGRTRRDAAPDAAPDPSRG